MEDNIQKEEKLYYGGTGVCKGCGATIILKLALESLGKNTVVVNGTGCLTLMPTYPFTPLKVGWFHNAIENAGSSAGAMKLVFMKKKMDVNVLAFAGDGATYDIGFQSLSHLAIKDIPVIYLCYNNQVFGNTGGQWSTATPEKAITSTTPPGKYLPRWKEKDLVKIIAAHGVYSATANPAFPLDLKEKIRKVKNSGHFGFIDALAICPTNWGFLERYTIKIGTLATLTGIWPLYEIDRDGILHLTYRPKELKPVEEFLRLQRRFRHLTKEDIKELEEEVQKRWELLLKYDGKRYV